MPSSTEKEIRHGQRSVHSATTGSWLHKRIAFKRRDKFMWLAVLPYITQRHSEMVVNTADESEQQLKKYTKGRTLLLSLSLWCWRSWLRYNNAWINSKNKTKVHWIFRVIKLRCSAGCLSSYTVCRRFQRPQNEWKWKPRTGNDNFFGAIFYNANAKWQHKGIICARKAGPAIHNANHNIQPNHIWSIDGN